MTDEKKPDHVITLRIPVPSKGAAARFATKRYLYEVRNIEEESPLLVPGAPSKVLRASVVFRVFSEDRVNNDEKLALFDQLTPGLDLTLRELTHGVYLSNGKPLKIIVRGQPARMASFICDPSVKDGQNAFTEIFSMQELLQAASGDDRLDTLHRRKRAPLVGQRVDKRVVGSGVDVATVDTRSEFCGWVFTSKPAAPTVDYDKETAVFNHVDDIGYAVYVPLATIRVASNLYFKLEQRWRAFIEEEHVVVVAAHQRQQVLPRRLQLAAGRQAPKARAPQPESKPEAQAEDEKVVEA